jgi:hypothetical protein
MSTSTIAAIDAEQAANALRHVDSADALEAGILNPMAGGRPVRLFSLEEAERFLVLQDVQVLVGGGAGASVHYVDATHLSAWAADVIGDRELSDGLNEIISSGKAYGLLVPEMKALIGARIEQYKQVLDGTESAAS